MRLNILVLIVTHNPKIEIILHNIYCLRITSSDIKILIIDNNSDIPIDLIDSIDFFLKFRKNTGLAYAYNIGLEIARTLGIKWLLILDQDSKLHGKIDFDKIFQNYNNLLIKDHVAIISLNKMFCYTTDQRIGNFIVCKSAVNSGSILNVDICHKIPYNTKLFLDRIDNEYCYRLRRNGYFVLAYNEQLLTHTIGDKILPYRKLLSRSVLFLFKLRRIRYGIKSFIASSRNNDVYVYYNNYLRYYFIIRNTIYLILRRMIDSFYASTLITWSLSLYERTNIIIFIKFMILAILHGIIGDLEKDNKKLTRYL
ncbi:glycosyltransferase [Sulfolobus tengchongensis]|uniref:Glycosyltransferase n=1 Tax=Sulfolobus tengchongensis TaxID=207809 RepID=A0AAX4L3X8_9CREN